MTSVEECCSPACFLAFVLPFRILLSCPPVPALLVLGTVSGSAYLQSPPSAQLRLFLLSASSRTRMYRFSVVSVSLLLPPAGFLCGLVFLVCSPLLPSITLAQAYFTKHNAPLTPACSITRYESSCTGSADNVAR
ncbi:hypothetical protein LZ30DRAFT_459878 [Colletotrichum cereale]|nr:hypothetical protein LZ30DRAFT_459878 [Colletotrichum cereale]